MTVNILSSVVVVVLSLTFSSICSAQTQLVSDDFSGTNGTFLGSSWTGCGFKYGAYNKLVYENNEAGGSGYWSQDCALYTGYGVFPSDQYASATIVAAVPSSTVQAAIQLRGNATPSADEAYIACGWDAQDFPADYHYRVWSLGPQGPGPVSLWLSNILPVTGDIVNCQVLGSTVTMSVNGKVVTTVADTSQVSSGYPGLYYNDPSSGGPSPTDVIFAHFSAGSGPAPVSTSITPASTIAKTGTFVQYTGAITYADGTVASMSTWSSSDTSISPIDLTGTAFGATPGTVTITGSSGPDNVTGTMTVAAGDGYGPLVYDTFVGTTGRYLGSNWTGCGNGDGQYSQLIYQNDQAGGSGYGSQDCSLYTGAGSFPSDQFATATVAALSPTNSLEASIEVRGNATPGEPNSHIACGWDAQDFLSDQHYRIWSVGPNAPPTSLYLSSVIPMMNDVIWCQVLGNTVTMQVNDATVAIVTDTSGVTSGYPGLFYIDPNQNGPPMGDVIFDNFAAGSINSPVIGLISVSPASSQINTNSTVQLTAIGTYTDGTVGTVTDSASWGSSNSSVATVNPTGLVSGVGPGSATFTASSEMGSGSATVGVIVQTQNVTFSGAPSTVQYLGTYTVNATTNGSVMPIISGTPGECSVGAVTGTPAAAKVVVTMLSGTGICTLTANWAASGSYSAAGPLTQVTTATKIEPTITFTGAPVSAAFGAFFNVTATTNASTMPAITGTSGVCTTEGPSGTPASASAAVTMSGSTGVCTVTATWSADANYSVPPAITQNTSATTAATKTTIVSNTPNPSTLDQPVGISFSVAATGAVPSGSVKISATTGEACTGTLSSGVGNCSIKFFTAGTRTLAASYTGTPLFSNSSSAGISETVNSPILHLSLSSLNFGAVPKGSALTMVETLSNTGTGALINLAFSITGTNAGEFTVSSTTCSTILNPGASCSVNVKFTPTATTKQTANLSLTENASNSPQTVSLSGS